MSDYRLLARAVAIMDLVLSAITVMWVNVIVMLAFFAILDRIRILQSSDPDHPAATVENSDVWDLFRFVITCTILIAVRTWAAIRLLSATEIGSEPVEALRLASSWLYVAVAFVVVGINLLYLGTYLPLATQLPVYGVMIYIVFRYIQELKR